MNKALLTSLTATVLGITGCQSTSSSAEHTSHISQSVYDVEFQSAQLFLTRTAKLQQAFTSYCSDASKDDTQLKQDWHNAMLAWMALQGQERGPAQALEQSWNVQFWPDKKNTTGLKMSALTKFDQDRSAQDKSAQKWTAEQISTQSVTVQGLGAIEWLLYDDASTLVSNNNTCATGVAITENLHDKARIIANAWQTNPWKSLQTKEWESEYISLLSNQLDYGMKKLSRPLANIGQPRPYFSESWRSETSLLNLKANLQSLQALYYANGDGLDAHLRAQDKIALADRVAHQFDLVLESWPEEASLFASLQSKDGYRMVLSQYNKLEHLKYLINEEVAIELGVIVGFNATDGD